MNLLIIKPFEILFSLAFLIIIYVISIGILYRKKSGILPYLVLILFPILGSIAIILSEVKIKSFLKK